LQARSHLPNPPSFALRFLAFPTISGNLLFARSKPRNYNYIGLWNGKRTAVSLIFAVSAHLLLSVRSAVRDCVLWTPFPNPRVQRDNQCLPPRKARFPANWDYFRLPVTRAEHVAREKSREQIRPARIFPWSRGKDSERYSNESRKGHQRIEHPRQELFVARDFFPLCGPALAARHFARMFSTSVQAMWRDFSFLPYSVSPIFPGVI